MRRKILIESKQHSIDVQKLLFKMDIVWDRNDGRKQEPQNTNGKYLFIDAHKKITYMPDDEMGKDCWEEDGREEIKMAHPKQMDFLNTIFFKGETSKKRYIVNRILSSGFYYTNQRDFLNGLL